MHDHTHVYLTPVTEDRSADFERFLTDVVDSRDRRPASGPRRPLADAQGDGGDLDADWTSARC